jgi:hypothetical protein
MAITFPTDPTNGQEFTANGIVYVYDATAGLWDINASSSSTGTSGIPVSDNPPTNPAEGDQWFSSELLETFIYYVDDNGSYWVKSNPSSAVEDIDVPTDINDLTDTSGVIPSDVSDLTDTGGILGAGGGGTTTYADMAALIAETGMSDGDQAFVLANNNLYIYKTNGWFKIATVENLQPGSISGIASSYVLADDGTPTVITATATDPEGFPLTWSYAVTTGSLGSTAAVSQTDNVFTITPSTTEADAGDFSITFSVTDGATTAVNAVSSFTLSFTQNFGITVQDNYQIVSTSYSGTGDSRTLSSFTTPDYIYIWSNGNGFNNYQMYRASLDQKGDISGSFSQITGSMTWWKQSSNTEYCKVVFYNDGNNAWIMHQNAADGFKEWKKYSFSTPYDLTTGTYLSSSVTLTQGDPYTALGFRDNGNLFFDGKFTDGVAKYTLSIPYDLTTATEAQIDNGVDGGTYSASMISPDGLTLISNSNTEIIQRSMSVAFDLTTLGTASTVAVTNSGEYAASFNSRGDRLYRTRWDGSSPVWIDRLPGPFSILGQQPSKSLSHSSGTVRAGTISSDGTKLYTTEYSSGTTRQWELSTPYDLDSATYVNQKSSITANVWHIQLKNDGSVLYTSDNSGQLKSFSLSTPYDITTLNTSPTANISMPSSTSANYGTFCFTPTGDRLIIASYDSGRLYQYAMVSPYDISDMTLQGDWSPGNNITPVSPRFNATGEKLLVNDISPIIIHEFDLAIPYDILTNNPVANGNIFDLRSIDTSNSTFTVEYQPSGDQFFVWGYNTGFVYSVDNTDWQNYQ